MSEKERLLIIGTIDELLIKELDYGELFTDEERTQIADRLEETIDTTSPKDFRNRLIDLGRKLYEEEKESD